MVTQAAVLGRQLQTADMLLDFQAAEVITRAEKERLRVKRDKGALMDSELNENLLAMVEVKPFETQRKFLEVVGKKQPSLVKDVLDKLRRLEHGTCASTTSR